MQKKIIFIPYWVYNTLSRYGLRTADVLNLNLLKEHYSGEDIASLISLNESAIEIFGIQSEYSNLLANTAGEFDDHRALYALMPLVNQNVFSRLFTPESKEEKYPSPFEIKDIQDNTSAVIVYPGYCNDAEKSEKLKDLHRSLLKLFYAYSGFDEMAHSQIFRPYFNAL